jgi:hypothetical protein
MAHPSPPLELYRRKIRAMILRILPHTSITLNPRMREISLIDLISLIPLILLILLIPFTSLHSQGIGVGTTTPDATAILDLTSTNKGILIPRMNSMQRNGITLPAEGLLVFDTDLDAFCYYHNLTWIQLGNDKNMWKINGNSRHG